MTSVGRDDSARRRGGFRPLGEFLSQRWERNQRIAGGDSHRRREQVPSGSSSSSPGPPFTGDTPIPFCRSSGAQNPVPGFDFSGPLGPGAMQNFGWYDFTAAPGSDQPWQRVQNWGGDPSTMAAAGGPQRKAQRSGFALERRSDGMSELCPSGRSEGYAIRDAEDPPLQGNFGHGR